MHQKLGGVRLRAWLRDHDQTQADLAEQVGTHQTNISAWILGRPIPIDKAIAIRDVTGIEVEDWVVDAERDDKSGPLPSKSPHHKAS